MLSSTCETACNSVFPLSEHLQKCSRCFASHLMISNKANYQLLYIRYSRQTEMLTPWLISIENSCRNLETKFSLRLMLSLKPVCVGVYGGEGGKHLHVLRGSLTSNARKPQAETPLRVSRDTSACLCAHVNDLLGFKYLCVYLLF